jgi:hypothetical protein
MTDAIRCEIRNTQILRNNKKYETCDNTVTANIIIKAIISQAFQRIPSVFATKPCVLCLLLEAKS